MLAENRFRLLILVLMVVCGCSYPKYIPEARDVGINPHGGYIEVWLRPNMNPIKGELIAVEKGQLEILTTGKEGPKFNAIPLDKVREYRLRFARSREYGWLIPVFTLVSFTHGFVGIFTLPLNLIGSITIATKASREFTYEETQIHPSRLGPFSRFPQGIPEGVDPTRLR